MGSAADGVSWKRLDFTFSRRLHHTGGYAAWHSAVKFNLC